MTEKKECPLKFAHPDRMDWGVDCSESACAWWNAQWDKCNIILEGHIAAFKQAREERG